MIMLILVFLIGSIEHVSPFNCNDGPPGRYCREDLTGYYICKLVGTRMTQEEKTCPSDTRCLCYFGPACPASTQDPCGGYRIGPAFSYSFTMTWHGLKSTENQGKPKKEVVTEQWYQLLAGGRNNSQSMRVWTGTQQTLDVIRPAASSGWSKHFVNYNGPSCLTTDVPAFPLYRVPANFNYIGKETLRGLQTDKWKCISGDRRGLQLVTEYYNTMKDPTYTQHVRPVRYSYERRRFNTKISLDRWVGIFFPFLTPDATAPFEKPHPCT